MRANFSTTFNTEEEKKQSQSFEGRLRSSSMLKQEVIPVGRQCKNIHKYAETVIMPLEFFFLKKKKKDWKMSRYKINILRMGSENYQWWAVRVEIV